MSLCAFASSARAQGVSDLQPATPQPAGNSAGGYWSPGMPTPSLGGASANNPFSASGGMKSERSGAPAKDPRAGRGEAVYDSGDIEGPIIVDDPHAGDTMPETHRVVKGDTLWDISNNYFRNPWHWPKLWALNPLVTNPHWIYPGDIIRLRAAGAAPPPPMATSNDPALPTSKIERGGADPTVSLRQTGFVEQGALKAAAKIVGSREEKVMLATGDEIYVEASKQQPLVAGESYSIYRVVSDVKHPDGRGVVGHIVEIVGDVEVRSVGENRIAKATITEAVNPVERGFRVGPLRRRFVLGDSVASEKDLKAVVLATMRPTELLGESMLVFLDRGKDDGVVPGNRFLVVFRGDGIQPLLQRTNRDDDRFPREVLGEVQVVEVRGKTSTAILLRSTKEVAIGDRLEARRGY